MRQKQTTPASSAEEAIKDIRRATRRHRSAEDKIRIVLEGLRGEDSISELCRREGIAASQYYGWSQLLLIGRSWRPASAGSPATRRARPPPTR
jgi:transposase-like protein